MAFNSAYTVVGFAVPWLGYWILLLFLLWPFTMPFDALLASIYTRQE